MFAAGFAAAIVGCVLLQPGSTVWLAGAVFAAVSFGAFFLRGRMARRIAICCMGLCVGLFWYAGYTQIFVAPAMRADGQTLRLSAVAADYPESTRYGASVAAEVQLEGRRYDAVIYLRGQAPEIRPGDTLQLDALLQLTDGERSEAGMYLRSRGVLLLAKARSAVSITPGGGIPARMLPARLAHALRQKIAALFPADTAGFLAALLTGRRSGLPAEAQTGLSIAGIYHVAAVSGMHVSILLGMIVLLCGARRRLAAAVGVPVVVLFVLMTGAPASAVRAGCMQVLLLLAPLAKRENDMPTSIMAALTLLLAANPWSALDVGLQLSFTSITGILLFSGPIYRQVAGWKWLRHLLRKKTPLSWPARTMASSFACSIGSLALSLPLSEAYFQMVSIAAPITNVLCLWAVTLLFPAGLVVCLAGFVLGQLLLGPAWVVSWLARYVLGVCALISRVPLAALYLENGYLWALAAVYYLAVLGYALRPEAGGKRLAAAALAVAFAVGLTLCYLDYHLPDFTFTALDVGQGQCLIYNCGTQTCLIDCGGDEDDSGELAARFLQANGEYRVEALVLTHYDADHVNGVCQLLRRVHVNTLYLPDTADASGLRAQIESQAKAAGSALVYVREDMQIPLGKAEIQIFAPVSDDFDNDCGLSCLASNGKYDILITGDMTQQAEWRLMSLHDLPDVELLVAGHHGARTSTSEALLALTQPETVLISVGKENSFGHPASQMLDRLRQAGAAVYRTDENGTITIRG